MPTMPSFQMPALFNRGKKKEEKKKMEENEQHVKKSETLLKPNCTLAKGGPDKCRENILEIAARHPTPFHLYDEGMIRQQCMHLKSCFQKFSPKYTNFFAVKATPTPAIMTIMKEEGFGADCSSLSELILSEKMGFKGEEIIFTSNNTPAEEYKKAYELGAIINFDDLTQIRFAELVLPQMPELVCFRFNPGPERTGNVIIGDPKEAKYGFTKPQLLEAYEICKAKGAKRFALHTMVISCCIDKVELVETFRMCAELCHEITEHMRGKQLAEAKATGGEEAKIPDDELFKLEFINLGGGIGIPYKPTEREIDLPWVSQEMEKLFQELMVARGYGDVRIVTECGRYITGPCGWLVTQVTHQKKIYKNYVGVDACMANLMRPGMYDAYHHITPVPVYTDAEKKEAEAELDNLVAVVGEELEAKKKKKEAEKKGDAVKEEKKMVDSATTMEVEGASPSSAAAKKAADGAKEDEMVRYISEASGLRKLRADNPYAAIDNSEAMKSAGYADKASLYDVTGGLCENNDKFAVDRPLFNVFPGVAESLPHCQPSDNRYDMLKEAGRLNDVLMSQGDASGKEYVARPGDLVMIHDAGAHGHSMGFQYNGKLRSAEVLLQADGSTRVIRRAETRDDLFACIADYY